MLSKPLIHLVLLTEPKEEGPLRAWEHCKKNTRSVEVVFKDEEQQEGIISKVYFNSNLQVGV